MKSVVYTVAITSSATRSSTTAIESRNTRSRMGSPGAVERKHPEREGSIRRHRRSPAVGARVAGVEGQVDRDRHRHAAEGRGQREQDPSPLAQLAQVELAPRLEPDHEEEERHQPLVHPLAQVERDAGAAQPHREHRVQTLVDE